MGCRYPHRARLPMGSHIQIEWTQLQSWVTQKMNSLQCIYAVLVTFLAVNYHTRSVNLPSFLACSIIFCSESITHRWTLLGTNISNSWRSISTIRWTLYWLKIISMMTVNVQDNLIALRTTEINCVISVLVASHINSLLVAKTRTVSDR